MQPLAKNGGGAGDRGAIAEVRRLLPYARGHAGLFTLTILASVALAVVDIPLPFFLKRVIDAVLAHHQTNRLLGWDLAPRDFLLGIFLCLVMLALGKGALLYFQRTVSETIGQRMIFDLRLDLYRHLQSLSMRFFRNSSTGRLMLRLMGDIGAVLDMITDGFLRALMDFITIAAVVVVIFVLHWKLTLVVLAGLPFYVLAFVRFSPELRRTGREARRERSALSGNLQEKISGAAVVKAFHREDAEQERMEEQTARLRDRLIEKARIGGRLTSLAHVAIALGGALVLWIGGNAVLDGTMTKGGLMAFYTLSAMLFPPLRRLAKTNETYQSARISLDRILDFFDDTTSLKESRGTAELRVVRGDVRFERVSFFYVPTAPVLEDLELAVQGGQVIALVGPNGAGKTTLLSMLTRFLEPDAGRVLIDGQDVRDVTLASLRRQVGIVTQETYLFSGTIEENIRYGRPEATPEDVIAAARAANALEFSTALPEGFQTDVGERGRRLSAGQIQRIALARAVLMDPPILILDEATSAVDSESEAQIQEAISRLTRGRTTFVIAHRASTVKRADRILVMERGKIVEDGSHEVLLARRGLYARLFEEQILSRDADERRPEGDRQETSPTERGYVAP